MGKTIEIMFRALVLTLCVLSAAASTSFEDQVNSDTIVPQGDEVFSFVEMEVGSGAGSGIVAEADTEPLDETTSGSGNGSGSSSGSAAEVVDEAASAVCVDQTNSDGTEWYDADGEYYDCEWYGSYESYCDWYGDDYASEMDGITASQACCTCGG